MNDNENLIAQLIKDLGPDSAEAERRAEETKRLNANIERKTAGIEIELADDNGWQKFEENNSDPYGAAVLNFAKRWAELMQVEMAAGAKLEDIAHETSREADTENITAAMHGAAVSVLALTWVHGDQLRKWHNKGVQVDDEGDAANGTNEVLNPAVVRF